MCKSLNANAFECSAKKISCENFWEREGSFDDNSSVDGRIQWQQVDSSQSSRQKEKRKFNSNSCVSCQSQTSQIFTDKHKKYLTRSMEDKFFDGAVSLLTVPLAFHVQRQKREQNFCKISAIHEQNIHSGVVQQTLNGFSRCSFYAGKCGTKRGTHLY